MKLLSAGIVTALLSVWMLGGSCAPPGTPAGTQCSAPVFTPDGGEFPEAIEVQVYSATLGAMIRYTTDGSTPSSTQGTVLANGGSITINGPTTLSAIAYGTDLLDSTVTTATYTLVASSATVVQPTFSPGSSSFATSIDVQIACATPGATIRYTTDGSTPSSSHGTMIASGGTVTLTSTTVLAAMAYASGMTASPVKQAVYTQLEPVAAPTFDPDGGAFSSPVSVQISCATAGATIRYTTDGSTPSQSNGTVIANGGSVTISSTTTLAAIAYAEGLADSSVKQATYTVSDSMSQVAEPAFNPSDSNFTSTISVQISCATAGATIRYTTDGSTPSQNHGSTVASGSLITLNSTTTLSAIAYASGMADSPVRRATYTKTNVVSQVAEPTFDPTGGTFASSVSVQISCATAGATIRYTTDGSTPSDSHGTPLDSGGLVTLNSTTTLAAIAYKNGMTESPVHQSTFTKLTQVAQPVFNPASGDFSGSVDVQITCSTSGATIRYTTDGTSPTSSHGTAIASGSSVHLGSTTTLKAIAYQSGMVDSAVTSVTFSVHPPGMVLIPAGEFQMGDPFTIEGDSDERPRHAVYVNPFFMDTTEVTNQEYADALNWALGQGGLITVTSGIVYQQGTGTSYPYCETTTSSAFSQITWSGSAFGVATGKADYPVVQVNWYGAVAYANWRSGMQSKSLCYDLTSWTCNWGSGYRLPTEAEWERAARGGVDGHRFPWTAADTIDHNRANYYCSGTYFYDLGSPTGYNPVFSVSATMPYTNPVTYFAANAYGLYGMAGNVWEWCNDWSDDGYYSVSPYSNPHGPTTGTNRILRGGSWGSTALNLRCAYRSEALPSYRAITNGFRLAISAD